MQVANRFSGITMRLDVFPIKFQKQKCSVAPGCIYFSHKALAWGMHIDAHNYLNVCSIYEGEQEAILIPLNIIFSGASIDIYFSNEAGLCISRQEYDALKKAASEIDELIE